MAFMHQCRVTTTAKTICSDEATQETRKQLSSELASYTPERVYRDLLRETANVKLIWQEESFSVPLKRSLLGLYLVPITIGEKNYSFVVDTGAQISSFHASLLHEHPMKKLAGALSIRSIGGMEKNMSGYMMDELKIGSLTVQNVPMVMLESSLLPPVLANIDSFHFAGILGWDILSRMNFELDDVEKKFKVVKNRYQFAYPNMVSTMFPIFLTKDENANLLVMGFDSGARYSWVNPQAMKKFAYPLSREAEMFGYGVHGMETMIIHIVPEMNLYLDRAHIRLRSVHTAETEVFHNVALDGILGNEIFRNRRIRLINHQAMVLLV